MTTSRSSFEVNSTRESIGVHPQNSVRDSQPGAPGQDGPSSHGRALCSRQISTAVNQGRHASEPRDWWLKNLPATTDRSPRRAVVAYGPTIPHGGRMLAQGRFVNRCERAEIDVVGIDTRLSTGPMPAALYRSST